MIRKYIFSTLILALAMIAVSGCGKKSAEAPIKFNTVKFGDTTSFKRSNGDVCKVRVDVSVDCPVKYGNKASTEKLQKWFMSSVLESGDSIATMEEAVKHYVAIKLGANAVDEEKSEGEDLAEESENAANKIAIAVKITAVYKSNGVLSVKKEETYKKDEVASKYDRYCNFDLDSMKEIDQLMFDKDMLPDLCEELKTKLMDDNDVSSSEELNGLGFFNIDNLTVTSNFYFGEEGVTWTFLPGEISAGDKFEPQVTLGYSTLKKYASSNSVLDRFE